MPSLPAPALRPLPPHCRAGRAARAAPSARVGGDGFAAAAAVATMVWVVLRCDLSPLFSISIATCGMRDRDGEARRGAWAGPLVGVCLALSGGAWHGLARRRDRAGTALHLL